MERALSLIRAEPYHMINEVQKEGLSSGLYGNCSGLYGNCDDCHITDDERAKGIKITELIKAEEKVEAK